MSSLPFCEERPHSQRKMGFAGSNSSSPTGLLGMKSSHLPRMNLSRKIIFKGPLQLASPFPGKVNGGFQPLPCQWLQSLGHFAILIKDIKPIAICTQLQAKVAAHESSPSVPVVGKGLCRSPEQPLCWPGPSRDLQRDTRSNQLPYAREEGTS